MNDEGELTSLGSARHFEDECSPCVFWFKGRCLKTDAGAVDGSKPGSRLADGILTEPGFEYDNTDTVVTMHLEDKTLKKLPKD